MAYQSIWHFTELPETVVNSIEEDLERYKIDNDLQESLLTGGNTDHDIRKAKNTWIPTSHWIAGFIWHYVQRANRENFLYDLTCIDGENLQYTTYHEGEFYSWHTDQDLVGFYKPTIVGGRADQPDVFGDYLTKNTELVRKLSFSLQLSDEDSYEGGQFQLINHNTSYFAPKRKGTLIVFDSRSVHRVRKVTKGVRKSIVGWVLGPRWR